MKLSEWMQSERTEENDNVCLFLSSIQSRLQREYPGTTVEVSLSSVPDSTQSPWYLSFRLSVNAKHLSLALSYIPHELSANSPEEVMAKATPEEIVATFIKHMECYQ